MDSSSMRALSICCRTNSHNLRVSHHQLLGLFVNEPKRITLSINPKVLPRCRIQLGKLHSLSSIFSQSPLSQPPIIISLTQNNVFKSTAGKLAILFVVSLLSMVKLGCKPALALPNAQKTSVSAAVEEKRETQNGKSGGGEDLYLKLLENNPRDIVALKVVFYGKMRDGKVKEAVEYVERLVEAQPEEVEWRLLQALCYEMMGNLSKAKRLFNDILEKRPLLVRALHGLALVMHKNKEGVAVFEMLDKALEVSRREKRVTEERNIRILIAQMYVVKGDLKEGLIKFQDLVNENPRDFRPYLCQGIIYSLLDRKKEADEQFEIYRSLVPDEFPQRGFLDDVMLAAKAEPLEQLEKQFEAGFSYRK